MSAVQLIFTLRTSPDVRTVDLLGSWDSYSSPLSLSSTSPIKDNPVSWRGTFLHALKPGSLHWYYYQLNGYCMSHDPAKEHITERKTGRILNVLKVPGSSISSRGVAQGRSLDPDKILHPKPTKPLANSQTLETGLDNLVNELGSLGMEVECHAVGGEMYEKSGSGPSSVSKLSVSNVSGSYDVLKGEKCSLSPISSLRKAGSCRCERYGVTRAGTKVMLDCGGVKCGYNSSSNSGDSSGCSNDGEEEMAPRRISQESEEKGVKRVEERESRARERWRR